MPAPHHLPHKTKAGAAIIESCPSAACSIVMGIVLLVAGLVVTFAGRLPFRLGHLPGDIRIEGKNSAFYFPITTCILLSVLFTLVMWIFRR